MANGNDPTREHNLEDATELLAMFPPLLQEAMQESEETFGEVYPERTGGPTTQDYRELGNLRAQMQRLTQPIQARQPIGTNIQGNPFALSTRGLSQGINSLMTAVETKRREKELFGDPKRRASIQAEIESVKERAEELRQSAQELRGGNIPGEVMASMAGQPMGTDQIEQMASRVEAEAEQLDQEVAVLNRKLEEYGGVAGDFYAKEGEVRRKEQDETFRNQFINTFGEGLFNTTVQTMRTREQLASLERREQIRQDAYTTRRKEELKSALEKLRLELKHEDTEPVEGSDVAPNQFKPQTIKLAVRNWRNDLKQQIEDIRNDITQDGRVSMEEAMAGEIPPEGETFPGDEATVDAYRRKNQFLMEQIRQRQRLLLMADEVELSAESFENSVFDPTDLPPMTPPTDAQADLIESMKDAGMPLQVIRAYEFYNRIDEFAVPNVPEQASDVGNYN